MPRIVLKNGQQNNPCKDDIGLHAYDIDTIVKSMIGIIESESEREGERESTFRTHVVFCITTLNLKITLTTLCDS